MKQNYDIIITTASLSLRLGMLAPELNAKTIDRPQPSKEDRAEKIQNATDYYKNTTKAKPGSLASKAQMVQQYRHQERSFFHIFRKTLMISSQ